MESAEHSPSAKSSRTLRCVVVTPETTVVDTEATFVALPLFDGEIGISPLHSPMIGRLGFGELRITSAAGTESYFVDGGFVQVVDNTVSVLTNRAVSAASLDVETAAAELAEANARRAAGAEAVAIRASQIAQARARLRVARRAR
jgi:F-type H+-transporting ATPase subunit epsilon